MALTKERFPLLFQDKDISISDIELLVKVKSKFANSHNEATVKLSMEAGATVSNNELTLVPWNGLFRAVKTPSSSPGNWTLTSWLDSGNGVHKMMEKICDSIIYDSL